jgi:DNA modification methylase
MMPYYQDDACTIYHGDCREILPALGRFDLLLTDPPYGLGMRTVSGGTLKNTQTKYISQLAESGWDKSIPSCETFKAMFSCTENQIIWGGNYFYLPPTRGILVWDKMTYVPTMSRCEIAWTSFDFPCKYRQENSNQLDRVHATQKPVPLFRWCLSFAPDAETILDPFMGSGTTLVAAKLEGRRAVGIELEERYCEIAANRLSQGVLF